MKIICRILFCLPLLLAIQARAAATNDLTNDEKASAALASLFPDPVIAHGKGVEIKRSELENAFAAYKARMAEQNERVAEDQRPIIERRLLDSLIVTRLLAARANDQDHTNAQKQTDLVISNYIATAGSEAALRRQLKLRGTTLERFTVDMVEEQAAHSVMDRELKSKITVSEAEVQDFYTNGVDAIVKIMQEQLERLAKSSDTTPTQLAATKKHIDDLKKMNLAKLQLPERVQVSHIFFAARDRQTENELSEDTKKRKRDLAQEVLAKARAGESWTNLVQKYSEDRNLPETHGEYIITRGTPYPFVAEFKAAAFSLTNSQISDIVTTDSGFHIIKLLDRAPAKKMEYEKAAPEIRTALLEQALQGRIPEFFEQVKKEGNVEIDTKYRLAGTALDLINTATNKN